MSDPSVRARLETNLTSVRQRLREACLRAGRAPDAARLVAITKGASAELVQGLYDLGVRTFGENRVQEALAKQEALPADCDWHLVGHLQRNKARRAAGAFGLIHSVDSERLAAELDAEGIKRGRPVTVLLEANLTGETGKTGCPENELEAFARAARAMTGLAVSGLMTMGREGGTPDETRAVFRRLREWGGQIWPCGVAANAAPQLSMGMSGDFEIAAEEGATLVRVGSALFQGVGREDGYARA